MVKDPRERSSAASAPPRRAAIVEILEAAGRPLHAAEIVTRLGVAPRHETALGRVLDDLVFDGTIAALPGHRFHLQRPSTQRAVERRGAPSTRPGSTRSGVPGRDVEGYLTVNPRGFGFVATEGAGSDIFVPAEALGGGLHGDRVIARIVGQNARGLEGVITGIVSRRNAKLAGTLRVRGKSAWVEPDDARVRGPIVLPGGPGEVPGAVDGAAVVARIERFPQLPEENPEGVLEAVLGDPGDPEVEVQKILLSEGVEEDHHPAAIEEAEAYGDHVPEEALAGREDLTHLPLPTIDPIDARDHDDAIWAERRPEGGYRVWIAIADVSHYVRPGTQLDASAVGRACSIYLPDRAIPMLPRALSSNLCSLLPDQLRLCLAAIVDLDASATVIGSRLVEGYMRSRAKLNYEGVARVLGLSAEAPRQPEAEEYRDDLKLLREISTQLRARRMRRGALDLELPEAKVVLEGKKPLDVVKRARDPGVAKAYQIVEEFMLLANEAVASFLIEHDVPAIFRNHGSPDLEKLARFAELAERLGVPFDADDGTDPKKLAAFLKKTASHERKQVLHMVLMRSMKQAVYETLNQGHFGLASEGYVHFTSPIRRYPDVVVHREVKAMLRKERIDRGETALEKMRMAAVTASERERRAMTIERQVVDLHRALVMRDKIGEIYGGTVSGINMAGAFVAIDEPFVDVLVRSETLGTAGYEPDDLGLALVAQATGDRIELGDAMMVQIEDVSIVRRTVFGRRLRDEAEEPRGRRGRGKVVEAAAGPMTERVAARRQREERRRVEDEKKTARRGSAPPSSTMEPARGGKAAGKAPSRSGRASLKSKSTTKPGKKGR